MRLREAAGFRAVIWLGNTADKPGTEVETPTSPM
jgi:hypothetical protein